MEDIEVKVLFLRSIDDSSRNFQVKENNISYIRFDEVFDILKNPSLKTKKTWYYQFDVHEKQISNE